MEIEFSGLYDRRQYFRAVSLAYQPSRRSVWTRRGLFLAFAAIFTGYILTFTRDQGLAAWDSARIMWHLILLFIVVNFLFQPYIAGYLIALRLWRTPSVRGTIAGRVSLKAITYLPSGNQVEWASFKSMRRTPDFAVLMTAARRFAVFPRHFFKSDRDWDKFLKILAVKLKEAA